MENSLFQYQKRILQEGTYATSAHAQPNEGAIIFGWESKWRSKNKNNKSDLKVFENPR